jgi:hypothetical protein
MKFDILSSFRKSVDKIQFSLQSKENKEYFAWKPVNILSYLTHFFLEWEMLQTKVVEKKNTNLYLAFTNLYF